MKYLIRMVSVLLLLGFVVCGINPQSNQNLGQTSQETPLLKITQTIALPDVNGRIDHMSVDIKGQRMFIAALGNNTVEAVDLASGKVIHSIKGLHEPQGVMFIPETNSIYVASGGNGDCSIYDGVKFNLIQTIKLGDDADNIRYDVKDKKLYVGYGDGALAVIDTSTNKHLGDIKLSGHPESYELLVPKGNEFRVSFN